MFKCYNCKKLISYCYNNKPICLCISNSKELKELQKYNIEECKNFKLRKD